MQATQTTARIYQFPLRGRAATNASRMETNVVGDLRATPAPQIVSGGGWYHEAAIQDAQRPVKH